MNGICGFKSLILFHKRKTDSLAKLNYLHEINKNWQLFLGGHVCYWWNDGKCYLY